MAFTKLLADLNHISRLDDEPNDVGGLTAAELKEEFDRAGNEIKDYINSGLIAELEGPGGAGNIGVDAVAGLTGAETVQQGLAKLVQMLQEISQGSVADGSITTAKLADGAVTAQKLGALSVGTAALGDLSVTGEKLSAASVTGEKLAPLSVTADRIADKTVTGAKLADKAVSTAKLADRAVGSVQIDDLAVTNGKLFNLSVTTEKLANGAVTPEKTTGVQRQHTETTATLAAAGWTSKTQTVSVAGVTASNLIFASPQADSWTGARDSGVRCTGQGAGTLTFTCEDVPTTALSYNVAIFN